jgi:hypothetical protein
MKIKPIFFCFFSFCFSFGFGQDKKETKQEPYHSNFMIGVDVLNLGVGFFSTRKLYQAYVSTEIKPRLHLVADFGFEKNSYQKNGYDATANGSFIKLGTYYMLIPDSENRKNGFYVGGKLAGSLYHQHYQSVPVRGAIVGDYSVAFEPSVQSSYWAEALLGARIQLFNTRFYIDANVQPKYLVYSTKQEEIQPMVVPGFGESTSAFGFGFSWALAYYF